MQVLLEQQIGEGCPKSRREDEDEDDDDGTGRAKAAGSLTDIRIASIFAAAKVTDLQADDPQLMVILAMLAKANVGSFKKRLRNQRLWKQLLRCATTANHDNLCDLDIEALERKQRKQKKRR